MDTRTAKEEEEKNPATAPAELWTRDRQGDLLFGLRRVQGDTVGTFLMARAGDDTMQRQGRMPNIPFTMEIAKHPYLFFFF